MQNHQHPLQTLATLHFSVLRRRSNSILYLGLQNLTILNINMEMIEIKFRLSNYSYLFEENLKSSEVRNSVRWNHHNQNRNHGKLKI